MDFFERQEKTRRQTRLLVLLFLLATAVIVVAVGFVVAVVAASLGAPEGAVVVPGPEWARANAGLLALACLGTLAFIGSASLYRTLRLSAGGGAGVARQLGGTEVSPDAGDPLHARLRNVVEEMAIASGVPVPDIYVLNAEPGINAFAAGYSPGDAAIAVTRGALEELSRDELQGVIAHEFSHVLNGDMRLSTRLMGLLFGILAISLIGRTVLRSGRYGRVRSSRRGGGSGLALLFMAGLALFLIGYIGVFCGRLIKAGASRERERLADASAVQFTRQTAGLAGALKKIGGLEAGATIKAAAGEEISHMLFALGVPALTRLLATHPPLAERIQALEPGFDPRELDRLRAEAISRTVAAPATAERSAGLAAMPPAAQYAVTPAMLSASAGAPREPHVTYARALREAMPSAVYDAAHSPADAMPLVLALILHPDQETRRKQLERIEFKFGQDRRRKTERLHADLKQLGDAFRLPLLDIALPALRHRPREHLVFLAQQARELADIDGRIELFEFALLRVLEAELDAASVPPARGGGARPAGAALRGAVTRLFAVLARHGHAGEESAAAAYARGIEAVFGAKGASLGAMPAAAPGGGIAELDSALETLRGLRGDSQRRLVEGLAATIMHDRAITTSEAELLRAICVTLGTPLPPLLAA